ncbi:MarR family transcriptional regulator [Francisellaceae bacterium]|nr:MarR family transcriptional regulator [Francisellaceae bacterium]
MNISNLLGYQLFETLKLVRAYTDSCAKDIGLTRTEWQVFASFELIKGPITQKDILTHLEIDKAHLARVLEGLQKKGYLKRKPLPDNRRVSSVILTKTGEKVVTNIKELMVKQHDTIVNGLSIESINSLYTTLTHIQDNLSTSQ